MNLKLKQTNRLAFRTKTLFSSSFNIPTKRFGITIVSNVVYHVQTKSSKQMFWVINNSLDMMILIFDRSWFNVWLKGLVGLPRDDSLITSDKNIDRYFACLLANPRTCGYNKIWRLDSEQKRPFFFGYIFIIQNFYSKNYCIRIFCHKAVVTVKLFVEETVKQFS
jgi:hypothetical protein